MRADVDLIRERVRFDHGLFPGICVVFQSIRLPPVHPFRQRVLPWAWNGRSLFLPE